MLRVLYAMLHDGVPYADPGVDYEAISIDRKAARWLKKLEQYGRPPQGPTTTTAPECPTEPPEPRVA